MSHLSAAQSVGLFVRPGLITSRPLSSEQRGPAQDGKTIREKVSFALDPAQRNPLSPAGSTRRGRTLGYPSFGRAQSTEHAFVRAEERELRLIPWRRQT